MGVFLQEQLAQIQSINQPIWFFNKRSGFKTKLNPYDKECLRSKQKTNQPVIDLANKGMAFHSGCVLTCADFDECGDMGWEKLYSDMKNLFGGDAAVFRTVSGKVKVMFLIDFGLEGGLKDHKRMTRLAQLESAKAMVLGDTVRKLIPEEFHQYLDFSWSALTRCFINEESLEVIRNTDFKKYMVDASRLDGLLALSAEKQKKVKYVPTAYFLPTGVTPVEISSYVEKFKRPRRSGMTKCLKALANRRELLSGASVNQERMALTVNRSQPMVSTLLQLLVKDGLLEITDASFKQYEKSIKYRALGWLRDLIEELGSNPSGNSSDKTIPKYIEPGDWHKKVFDLAKFFVTKPDIYFENLIRGVKGSAEPGKCRVEKCAPALRWWRKLFGLPDMSVRSNPKLSLIGV